MIVIRASRRRWGRDFGCIRGISCGSGPTAALKSKPSRADALA
ncbi:hypothetical protein BDD21_2509 [Thiocapsa rosea]|uniref:Uncharacterized protein n=1 Tax=Thiocapsa rosea TaxID=69360 RepID=A0A495V6S3_9GAMM|nr:hypothetical protein BDD21_2509 [Thiocapsa rosea]